MTIRARLWVSFAVVTCFATGFPALADYEHSVLVQKDRGLVFTRVADPDPDDAQLPPWNALGQNQQERLGLGALTRTYPNSLASCWIGESGVKLRLGPNTLVSVTDLLDSEEQFRSEVRLENGNVRSLVQHTDPRAKSFKVRTPNATLSARGTEWHTQYNSATPPAEVVAEAGNPVPDTSQPASQLAIFDLGGGAGETRCATVDSTVHVESSTGNEADVSRGHTAIVDPTGNIQVDPAALHFVPGSSTQVQITEANGDTRIVDLGSPAPPPPPIKAGPVGGPSHGVERGSLDGDGNNASENSVFHPEVTTGSPGGCQPQGGVQQGGCPQPQGGGMPGGGCGGAP